MLGCFTGVVVIALAKSPIFNHERQIEKTTQFYLGLVVILFSAILFSVGGVLIRKMKAVHFSVIQFNYGFLAFSSLSIWVLV
jgi:drug/metabolite transporter (DMT)-like permease